MILESNAIASGSSGKGGGLIASWAEPECLAQPSFPLHEELANLHDRTRKWGYRRVTCADCMIDTTRTMLKTQHGTSSPRFSGANLPQELDWVRKDALLFYQPVGSKGNTAQCDPFLFTTAMFEEARTGGASFVQGTAVKIEAAGHENAVVAVRYIDVHSQLQTTPATHVIIAAGPWSSNIMPEASVSGARCHSLVFRPSQPLSSNLLFADVTYESDGTKQHLTPEVYPRPDGTVYACESADPTYPLPASSAEVVADAAVCHSIQVAVGAVSQQLHIATVEKQQVCYQPIVTFEGKRRKLVGPFLGNTSTTGAYIACGHDSWGISNAPATGKALSELIYDGQSVTVDISSLSIQNVMSRAKG